MAHRHHSSRRKRRAKKIILGIILTVLVLFLAVMAGAYFYLNSKLNQIEKIKKEAETQIPREEESFEADAGADTEGRDVMEPDDVEWTLDDMVVMNDPDITNILLIGQDRHPDEETERSRSDSMIIVSINRRTNKIHLSSLMRDMYVPIPGYSDNRINEAYKMGGMTLLDQTIEQDFGVHINGNVEVDFERFVEVMTQVGDVPITVTEEECEYMQEHMGWTFEPGEVVMTPEQLLSYCRIRRTRGADFERTARQRKVIRQLFKKFMTLSPNEMLAMLDKVLPYVGTDLSNTEIIRYGTSVLTNKMQLEDQSTRIPIDNSYTNPIIREMDVLVPDLKANSDFLKQAIYGMR